MVDISAVPLALVTGAAQRIGAAIVRTLHGAGFEVILHYHHSRTAAASLAQELNQQRPRSVHVLQANLLDPAQLEKLTQDTLALRGTLNLLVNNASRFYPTPLGSV
ncbi:MAG: SDR family NAD(P)-dependent oxidoreductase, partial [Pseudomonadales bacterium]|nr:SDR family NAD(P)-dependent oxidoreductase [Pseudomonadales bacterium]